MPAGKIAAILAVLGFAAVTFVWRTSRESHSVFEPVIPRIESQTPCPWRDAEADMTNWFPGATRYVVRDLVLSGQRLQLQERLGRPVLSDEMALHCYPVLSNESVLGTVLTRRMKGEHGAMEVALALSPEHRVRHFKIQRIREPSSIVDAVAKCELQKQIENKSLQDEIAFDCPDARTLAENLRKEVKALLILYDLGYSQLPRSHH
jgi:hypothetical protein